MKAVVLDFFGTLTDPSLESGRRASFSATAAALGVPADAFWTAMSGSFPERVCGLLGDTRATLEAVARRCGAAPSDAALTAAVAAHLRGAAGMRGPRPEALTTLRTLRAAGFRLGLISDCSSELVESWPSTPYAKLLDAAVFSWQEGYRKPDRRLYETVARRLGVRPADCWFVGDGGSREHWGAARAGMRPVLVTNAGYAGAAALRDDPDSFRPAATVDDLSGLPALVCHDHACP
ncbi:HAD family hydrolase [Actinoplanes sp. NPDC051475]|uniref:HAD family hydrolase n=1 Tax=Actinoplanes sp. NPDC051475 TaxID=3157225 RepID=UPI00344BCF13